MKKMDELCLGCLCCPNDCKIQDYKIQYAHFRAICEANTIKLCYLCKRMAQNAELFIQNVQRNQVLLQNCIGDLVTTIKEARLQFHPLITLSQSPVKSIDLTEKNNIDLIIFDNEFKIDEHSTCNKFQNSTYEVMITSDIKNDEENVEIEKRNIKVELKVEEDANLDLEDRGLDDDDEYPDQQDPSIKEEEVDNDFPLNLLIKEVKTEAIQKTVTPPVKQDVVEIDGNNVNDTILDRKTQRMKLNESLGIKKILITKEELMEERKQQALDKSYLDCAYRCEDCIKGFNFKVGYDNHMKKHSEESGRYKCDICKLRVNTYDKFSIHKQYHTVRFQCTECGIVRTSRSTLVEHHNVKHKQGDDHFACPYCPKTFRRFQCTECGIVRTSRSTLVEHHNVKHKQGDDHFACPYCPKTFRGQTSQRKHVRNSHQKRERVTCEFCNKTYASKEALKSHKMIKHTKEVAAREKKYPCEECGKLFRSTTSLKVHKYNHSATRDYYCVECDKAFKSEAILKLHLRRAQPHVTNSDLPFGCEKCDKRFALRNDMERHMNSIHLESKDFKCDKCDKAYGSKKSLRVHERSVHEGYKRSLRFPCHFCNKIFDHKTTFNNHIRTHTGERPFQCDKCPANFSQSGSLATHKKQVHQRLTRDGKPKRNAGLKDI